MTEEQYLFNVNEYPWHSPRYVLEGFDYLLASYDADALMKEKIFEKAREMRVAAICLLTMHQVLGEHFLMQRSHDQSPDVRTMVLKEGKGRPVKGFFQEVEIVTLDSHSSETDLVDFLKRTKLSKKYSYDEKTIILCEIKKEMIIAPYLNLHQQLSKLAPTPTVMIIGKTSPDKNIYSVCQLWPILELNVTVDVPTVANSYPAPHNLRLHLGMAKRIIISKSLEPKPTYFEIFGISPDEIKDFSSSGVKL